MHFDPFNPNPNNVLLQYKIDTGNIDVSANTGEALCNVSAEDTADICRRVKQGEKTNLPFGSHEVGLKWSDEKNMIVTVPPFK